MNDFFTPIATLRAAGSFLDNKILIVRKVGMDKFGATIRTFVDHLFHIVAAAKILLVLLEMIINIRPIVRIFAFAHYASNQDAFKVFSGEKESGLNFFRGGRGGSKDFLFGLAI